MKKKKQTGKRSKTTSDLGSPELQQHFTTVVEDAGPSVGRHRLRVVDGCELDRLFHQRFISSDQHSAGLRLGGDFIRAGCKIGSLNPSGAGKGGVSGGRFLFAIQRISRAMSFVQREIDVSHAKLAMSVAANERRITSKREITKLSRALDVLSSHYSRMAPSSLR